MPTLKVSAMDAETDFDHDDLLYLVRGGNSKKIVASDFRKAMFDPRYAMMLHEDFLLKPTFSVGQRVFGFDGSSVGGSTDYVGTLGAGDLITISGPDFFHLMLFDGSAANVVRSCFVPSTQPTICEWRVKFTSAPSATDPAYFCRVGMRSIPSYNTDTSSCHGVWAELYHNGTAPVWKLVAEAAGSKTSQDASTGITTNTWHRVAVVYTTSNAYLFLDGTQIASVSSGLPTSGSAPCIALRKTAGGAVTVTVDYVWVYQPLSNGR